MALYKKEVVVRPNSSATYEQAIAAARGFVNGFQNAASNSNGSGGFVDFFFADLFDSRDGNVYRVFSDACATEYSMPTEADGLIKYDIVNNAVIEDHETRIEVLETTSGGGTEAYVID